MKHSQELHIIRDVFQRLWHIFCNYHNRAHLTPINIVMAQQLPSNLAHHSKIRSLSAAFVWCVKTKLFINMHVARSYWSLKRSCRKSSAKNSICRNIAMRAAQQQVCRAQYISCTLLPLPGSQWKSSKRGFISEASLQLCANSVQYSDISMPHTSAPVSSATLRAIWVAAHRCMSQVQ